MSDAVLVAVISGVCSMIVGVVSAVISAKATGNDVQKRMEIAQAILHSGSRWWRSRSRSPITGSGTWRSRAQRR